MAETVESLQFELTANLGPLFAALEQGLKGVKDRLNAFKGEGKVELTASLDKMLGQLGEAKAKTAAWKRETDAVSVVQPSVNPAGFVSGLSGLRERAEAMARQLGNVFFAAAGFREISHLFGEWIRASGEQEVALARLRASLSAAGAAGMAAYAPLKAQAEELAEKYGQFGDEAIQSGQAVLASFKLTKEQIEALTPVLLDAATGLTKMGEGEVSLEQVAMLVGKALNGHVEALQRLGIQVDATRYKIDPLGATIDALNRRFQGLTAAVAETDEGKLKSLQERFGEIQEVLGGLVTGVIIPLAEALKPMVNLFLQLPEPVQRAAVVLGAAAVAMRALDLSLAGAASRLVIFASEMTSGAVAALERFGAALVGIKSAAALEGAVASVSALRASINAMSVEGKAGVLGLAAAVGYLAGQLIAAGIDAWADHFYDVARAEQEFDEASLRATNAALRHSYGIQLSAEAYKIWQQLAPATRHALAVEASAADADTISMQRLTEALQAQEKAREDLAQQNLWADEKRQLDEYLVYYRRSRAEQIAMDIAAVEASLREAQKGSDEEKKLQQQLSGLLRQAAQEKARAEQDAARQSQQAWAQMVDAAKAKIAELGKAITDAAARAKADWESASKAMAADMLKAMDPAEYERAQVRIEAMERERLARSVLRGQELADALVRIEEWKTAELGRINDRYRQEEQDKAQRQQEEEAQRAQRALNEMALKVREKAQAALDPFGAMVQRAYQTLNAQTAIWAERIAAAMQPLSNAIQSLLMGMKVSWANVLRQMLVTFVMQFVNKFLAWIAQMVVAWVAGEESKTTATAEGAVAQAAAARSEQAANAGVAASAMSAAIAEIFEAHAWIPFVGVAIASAFAEEAVAVWAALSAAAAGIATAGLAMASGGLVDRPTLTLAGEAGPELFAPAADFKEVVGVLLADTLATARLAAIGVGTAARGEGSAAAGAVTWEPHFHGMALVDTGNRAMLRATARKLRRALWDESRQKLGR